MPRQPRSATYDAIVIGGGISGLAAAATLAKAGRSVLLLESAPRLGGLMAPLVHGAYEFDVGPRLVMGCNADGRFGPGAVHAFLERMGVRALVDFIPLHPMVNVQFPEVTARIWSGRARYVEGVREAAQADVGELAALLDLGNRLFAGSKRFLTSGRPWSRWRTLLEMPQFVRYAGTTAGAMLERYVPDRRARRVVGSLWPYLGVPPRRASFVMWAIMMAAYIEEGAYFCRGGLHRITDAIAAACTAAGAELLVGTAVNRVLVRGGRVTGVELSNGDRCESRAVIATVDPRVVVGGLMDSSASPARYRRRLGRLTASDRGLSVSFVTDLDPSAVGLGFEHIIFDGWDEDQVTRNPTNGASGCLSLHVPTAVDPDLAPPGQHLVSVFAGLPGDAPVDTADVHRYAERVMHTVLTRFPQWRERLCLATDPATPGGYVSHVFGPVFGWQASPWEATVGRPDQHTPIDGLVLAGQWTRPTHGIMPALVSGCEAANVVMRAS